MKLQNKKEGQKKFNAIIDEIKYTSKFQDRISSQEKNEYITLRYVCSTTVQRFVTLAFDEKTEKLQIHVWEKSWQFQLGMYYSFFIFRSEIEIAEFSSGDVLHFAILPVLDRLMNY